MTLLDIITSFKELARVKPNINYVGSGDIYQLNSLPNIDYSVFFVTQNAHNWTENTITYSLNLYYIDRLLVDRSNAEEIQNTGILQLQNIINTFNDTIYDVDFSDVNFTPFYHKFADDCAGVYCTIQITAPSILGYCYE